MDIRDTIVLLGSNLQHVGDTMRTVCPVCRAGHEKSLSITRKENGLVYICPRSKCKLGSGIVPDGAQPSIHTNHHHHPRYFKHPLRPLHRRLTAYLESKYNITRQVFFKNEWKYDYTYNRLYMPLYTINGDCFGAQLKRLPTMFIERSLADVHGALAKPKSDNYIVNHDVPMLHFPVGSPKEAGEVVIVEDMISAIRLSPWCLTAATIGHVNVNAATAAYLSSLADVLIAIPDPDALYRAFSLKKDYGGMFNRVDIVAVDHDVKDLEPEAFTHLAELLYFTEPKQEVMK